jgi:hypothetical protein
VHNLSHSTNDQVLGNDGDGDDTVECGAGTDTVFFDEGENVLVVPEDCERKNPRL